MVFLSQLCILHILSCIIAVQIAGQVIQMIPGEVIRYLVEYDGGTLQVLTQKIVEDARVLAGSRSWASWVRAAHTHLIRALFLTKWFS